MRVKIIFTPLIIIGRIKTIVPGFNVINKKQYRVFTRDKKQNHVR